MSRTYRRAKPDEWDDADKHASTPIARGKRRRYATPRYQPGSRSKPRHISAVGVRREPPDFDKLMRALAQAALETASDGQADDHSEAEPTAVSLDSGEQS